MGNIVITAIGVVDNGVESMDKQVIGYGLHLTGMYGVEKSKVYTPVFKLGLSLCTINLSFDSTLFIEHIIRVYPKMRFKLFSKVVLFFLYVK